MESHLEAFTFCARPELLRTMSRRQRRFIQTFFQLHSIAFWRIVEFILLQEITNKIMKGCLA